MRREREREKKEKWQKEWKLFEKVRFQISEFLFGFFSSEWTH